MKGGRNQEGYTDPTATTAVGNVMREQRKQSESEIHESEKRAYDLIKILKYIIGVAGFELIERVQLKDSETGRIYK